MHFIEGLLYGLGFVIILGPVLFTLIKSSISHGFKAGFAVATGIIVSDILAALLCFYGAAPFFENEVAKKYISIGGGFLLIGLGLNYLLTNHSKAETKDVGGLKLVKHFTNGFLVNFVNPFVFIVWIGLITYGQNEFENNAQVWQFLIAVMIGIYSTDITKAYFASKINKFLTPKNLNICFKIVGVILVLFGGWLIIQPFR